MAEAAARLRPPLRRADRGGAGRPGRRGGRAVRGPCRRGAAAAPRGPGRGPDPRLPGRRAPRWRAVLDAAPGRVQPQRRDGAAPVPALRPQGDYAAACRLLRDARPLRPGQVTKSGLMLGPRGDATRRSTRCSRDLRGADVDIVTLGQYLRPTRDHAPVRPLRARRTTSSLGRAGARPRLPHRVLRRVRAVLLQRRGGLPRRRRAAAASDGPRSRGRGCRRSPASSSPSPSRSSGTGSWPGSPSCRCWSPWRAPAARATASGSAT